ncbi:MAG: iron chelate uptake ABC transporter family permease subunit, partial [Firmicutes bacterium]|nr:iron chelate uptake ABC transporter family permease subunit [Bacillota bacterium]
MSKESLINRKHIVLRMMIIVFIIILVLSILLAVTIGAVKISLGDVYRIVLYNATHFKIGSLETGILIGDLDFASKGTMYEIVWNVRMPRVMMGAIVGVLLAMCGVVMQATVQNPLADPYILGISSGASLGATFS